MSSGSTFIMTMWEGKKAAKKTLEKAAEKYRQQDPLGNKPEILPLYMEKELRGNNYNYIETATRKVLVPIAEWSFCSSFTVMKDYYNMDPNKRDAYFKELTGDVHMWKQAVDYIIHGKYSSWLEGLLNNPFVDVLKEDGYAFFDKKVIQDEEYLESDLKWLQYILASCEGIMKNDLCDKYNSMNKKEYKLLYMAW